MAAVTELMVAQCVCEKFSLSLLHFRNDNHYDFALTDGKKTITYEVKEDKMSGTTGNIAIEFECYGKPSGISVSKSDYYAIVGPDREIYIIETNKLKSMIKFVNQKEVTGGDPGSNTKMKLIKAWIIKKNSKIIRMNDVQNDCKTVQKNIQNSLQ